MERPETQLAGEAVRLREWRRADAPALAAVCGESAVCAFTSVPWTYTRAAAEDWVERQRRKREEGGTLSLAIVPLDGGAGVPAGPAGADSPGGKGAHLPVGNVNLSGLSAGGEAASLGYWLVPEARGKGLASAAARLLCDWGFGELGLRRIELEIRPDNDASRRLAERLGATREGLRRESHLAGGRRWDMVRYSLSAPVSTRAPARPAP